MNRLLPFLLLPFLSLPVAAQDSVAAIKELVANVQLTHTLKYLEAHPDAPDRLLAVNMVLESMQRLKQFDRMAPYLLQRYEIYTTQPEVKEASLVNATAAPLYSLYLQQRKSKAAADFKARALEDWAGKHDKKLALAFATVDKQYAMPKVGQIMPDVTFTDFRTGRPHSLKALRGNVVLMSFWISDCDICKAQRVFTRAALDGFGDQGFTVLGFSQNEDQAVLLKYLSDEKITWPQCWDLEPKHRWAQKLNLVGVPTNFLLDKDGKIAAVNLRDDALIEKIEALHQAP